MTAPLYGVLAEFGTPKTLLVAAQMAYAEGYRKMDAYSPYPIDGLAEAIGFEKTRVPLVVLIGGIIGGGTAYGMQYYSAVWDYPLNVGGRPLHSWPAFIPITFELTILGAALACVFGMLALNGLPRLHHPIFNTPGFTAGNASHAFLCISAINTAYDPAKAADLLRQAGAQNVWEVPS